MLQLSRRKLGLATCGFLIAAKAVGAEKDAGKDGPVKEQVRTAEDWLREWDQEKAKHKELVGPLDLRRFKDPIYVLLAPVGWKPPKSDATMKAFTVPRGFVTDFASVPRPFWSLFRPDGDYAYAAVLHDYLYWVQDRPKAMADKIFRAAMDDLKITDRQASTLYSAVDLFGTSAWESNRARKQAGEKRILSKLPTRSDITWAEWQRLPNVLAK